ncbi:MAG: hypothetical protein KGS72_22475 [Cyanobacteria bacterium REEB67]|nr:hypothetical protein [Cyanobacteria bacterium REEB67]
MLNSIGPLGSIALILVVFALFIGGFFVGHSMRRKDTNNLAPDASKNSSCFGLTELLVFGADLLFIGGTVFFVSIGDVGGSVVLGCCSALITGIAWGLSNCDFAHVRMF